MLAQVFLPGRGCVRDRYPERVSTSIDPDAADLELAVQLQTELAIAKAEREAAAARASALRRARLRFVLIVLILAGIAGGLIYLTLSTLRDAFGA